ncbi:hypothetical protein ACH427_00865 [Streptomyces sp. NPDC020379]|uniref:hypothetical protein n=1 Tax=Streptomyces sp. NPDC020379 TaxID=3365071 RepID=UPI0037A55830
MSAKHRIAAATVLAAAVAAVVWPTAGAFAAGAADKDGHSGHPTTIRQIQLPDGSHARLTSGEGGTKATVTTHGKQQRTIDTTRPAADIDRLHLRIIGGDTARPTLRAAVDGTEEPSYYDFTSGSLVKDQVTDQTKDHQRGTKAAPGHATRPGHDGRAQHGNPHTRTATPTAAAEHHGKVRAASSNPVRRVVEAGEAIKGRHDIGTPAIAGAALLAAGGGAYGVRIALRRSGRTGTDA